MKTSFSVNLYDKDGDCYEKCILIFVGEKEIILKFKDLFELKEFIGQINGQIIPEILENCSDELSESDLAEFGE